MFERFTEKARNVVVAAQDEARRLHHGYIGSEHLLLGLLACPGTAAHEVLADRGMELNAVREQVVQLVGRGVEVEVGQIPFTPRAKSVLENSLREALSLGHNFVGTEHILLALDRDGYGGELGIAGRILRDEFGDDSVRDTVVHRLMSESRHVRKADFLAEQLAIPRVRCSAGFALYGAEFRCGHETGHDGHHTEYGNGWRMSWEDE